MMLLLFSVVFCRCYIVSHTHNGMIWNLICTFFYLLSHCMQPCFSGELLLHSIYIDYIYTHGGKTIEIATVVLSCAQTVYKLYIYICDAQRNGQYSKRYYSNNSITCNKWTSYIRTNIRLQSTQSESKGDRERESMSCSSIKTVLEVWFFSCNQWFFFLLILISSNFTSFHFILSLSPYLSYCCRWYRVYHDKFVACQFKDFTY